MSGTDDARFMCMDCGTVMRRYTDDHGGPYWLCLACGHVELEDRGGEDAGCRGERENIVSRNA